MPVIPSFSDYAPAPDLAQAYLGQQKLQQEAAADAARISLGYATLRQRAVENEMQLAAQKEALSRENFRKAQETEIEKAYRDTQLGLAERELKSQETLNQMKLQDAAANFAAAENYRRAVEGGMPPDAAMRRYGFGQPGFSNAFTQQNVPRITASEKQLRYRELQRQWKVIDDKYPGKLNTGMSADDSRKMNDLESQMASLTTLPTVEQAAPVSTRQEPQKWIVNPETIPYGIPEPPGMFIGTPGQIPTDPGLAPLTIPNSVTNAPGGLRVLQIRKRQ